MKRVLVVEDSTPIRVLLATVLADAGFSVESASTGESALSRAAHTAYDLVVTDMTLPGIGGSELISSLRALELQRSTPVLVITAVTRKDKLQASREAGASAFIFKPFKSDHVVQTVRGLLAESEPYGQAVQPGE